MKIMTIIIIYQIRQINQIIFLLNGERMNLIEDDVSFDQKNLSI